MTITVTWPNVYKLTGLVMVVLSLILTAGSGIIQIQIGAIEHRLEERMKIYQADQVELRHRMDRIETEILRVKP